MRHRDARRCRNCGKGRNARDDLERQPRFGERECLLAATAEDERVASLQADDGETLLAEVDEQVVDLVLVEKLAGDADRTSWRFVDELLCNEAVVDDGVARAQQVEPANGDQPGVTRPGADERNGHASASSTSAAK